MWFGHDAETVMPLTTTLARSSPNPWSRGMVARSLLSRRLTPGEFPSSSAAFGLRARSISSTLQGSELDIGFAVLGRRRTRKSGRARTPMDLECKDALVRRDPAEHRNCQWEDFSDRDLESAATFEAAAIAVRRANRHSAKKLTVTYSWRNRPFSISSYAARNGGRDCPGTPYIPSCATYARPAGDRQKVSGDSQR